MGAGSLAEAHLAPVEPSCFCSPPRSEIPTSDKTTAHCIRVRYAQTNIPHRGSSTNGFTFVRLPSQTLDLEKFQVRT